MVVSDGGVGWTRLNNSEKREKKKKEVGRSEVRERNEMNKQGSRRGRGRRKEVSSVEEVGLSVHTWWKLGHPSESPCLIYQLRHPQAVITLMLSAIIYCVVSSCPEEEYYWQSLCVGRFMSWSS